MNARFLGSIHSPVSLFASTSPDNFRRIRRYLSFCGDLFTLVSLSFHSKFSKWYKKLESPQNFRPLAPILQRTRATVWIQGDFHCPSNHRAELSPSVDCVRNRAASAGSSPRAPLASVPAKAETNPDARYGFRRDACAYPFRARIHSSISCPERLPALRRAFRENKGVGLVLLTPIVQWKLDKQQKTKPTP